MFLAKMAAFFENRGIVVPLAALALLLALLSGVLSCALRRARLGSARSRARFLEIVTALRIPRARKPALFFI